MSVELLYTCSECGHQYTDAYRAGRARLTIHQGSPRGYPETTDIDWCSQRCFENGLIRAADKVRRPVAIGNVQEMRRLPAGGNR